MKPSQHRMNQKRSKSSLAIVSSALHVHDPLFQTRHKNYDLRQLIRVTGTLGEVLQCGPHRVITCLTTDSVVNQL